MLPSSPLFTLLHTTSAQPLAVLSPEQFGQTLFHPNWRSISETVPLLQKYTVLPSYSKPHTRLVLWNALQSPTPTTTFSVCFVSPVSVSACLSSHVPCHCATHASETSNLSKMRKLSKTRVFPTLRRLRNSWHTLLFKSNYTAIFFALYYFPVLFNDVDSYSVC